MSTTVKSAPIPLSRQREKPGQPLKWIGKNIKRVDPRLLTGQGRHRRHRPAQHATRGGAAQYARARPHQVDRRQRRTALKGVVKVLTGADIASDDGATAVLLQPDGRAALRRRRPRPPRRRSGRRGGGREPPRGRGRARSDRGRVRRPAGDVRPGGGGEGYRRRRTASRAWPDQRRDAAAVQIRAGGGDFADAARIVRRRLRWPRSGAQPLEPSAPSPSTRAARASSPST